jgi:deoxyribodipyrimidine photo-lyase
VKRCFERAITCAQVTQQEAINSWIAELLWRDFYKHISYYFPHVCKGQSFHLQYDEMVWDRDEEAITAWKTGNTGYPLVDAAMRQLLQTGWMHNRLRMLVAMFFCKLMYQDWRIGEQFFMEHLIDGDFSANNGGWQWSSATGTDAAPYFRIFNPKRQSEHFDPQGVFIRQYLPILASLNPNDIHAPRQSLAAEIGYPPPILDYEKARKMSLDRFLAFKGRSRRGRHC